jgi:hypothetical protein
MKRLPLILLLSLTAFYFSCSKEYSEESGSPNPSDSPLLVRYVLNDDVSRVESNFDYNSGNRVLAHRLSAATGAFAANLEVVANRDANDRITNANVVVRTSFNPLGDTIRYIFNRNAAGRINYYLIIPFDGGFVGYDSVACTYNAENKLVNQLVFLVPYDGSPVEPLQRMEMSYAGNNLISARSFALSGSTTGGVLEESISYEYDNRPAALPLTEDEFIIGLGLDGLGVNNPTKIAKEYADPSDNLTTEYRYTYGTNGRPATAEVTSIVPGLPNGRGTATYTYR